MGSLFHAPADDVRRPGRAVLDNISRVAAMTGSAQLPLLTFAQERRGNLVWAENPAGEWPGRAIEKLTRPTIYWVDDDPWPNGESVGPLGWRLAPFLRDWAVSVVVRGAAGELEHYREAVREAELTGRCAIIDTDSAHAYEWAEFIRCPRTLLIVPPPGTEHPSRKHDGVTH